MDSGASLPEFKSLPSHLSKLLNFLCLRFLVDSVQGLDKVIHIKALKTALATE